MNSASVDELNNTQTDIPGDARNYYTRTYSGANLMPKKSKTPSVIPRTFTCPNLNLDYAVAAEGKFAAAVNSIDPHTEMKLMGKLIFNIDIIMGNDILNEACYNEKEDKKKLNDDINSALHISISGNKKAVLQANYEQIQGQFFGAIRQSGRAHNARSKNVLAEFKQHWTDISHVTKQIGDLITSEKIAYIDLKSYEESLASIANANLTRNAQLDQLEQAMEQIEKERVQQLSVQVSIMGENLKALNYQPPATIDRFLQVFFY